MCVSRSGIVLQLVMKEEVEKLRKCVQELEENARSSHEAHTHQVQDQENYRQELEKQVEDCHKKCIPESNKYRKLANTEKVCRQSLQLMS